MPSWSTLPVATTSSPVAAALSKVAYSPRSRSRGSGVAAPSTTRAAIGVTTPVPSGVTARYVPTTTKPPPAATVAE